MNNYLSLQATVLSWIAEMLGVAADELSPELHLDADLALDSIKMMGLMSHLSEKMREQGTPLGGDAVGADIIMRLQTLNDIVAFVAEQLGVAEEFEVTDQPTAATADNGAEPLVQESGEAMEEGLAMPILNSQYLFMVSRFVTDTSALCHSVHLQGPLDRARAQQAWQQLVDRHPVLQCRFSAKGEIRRLSDYQFQLHPKPQVPALPCDDIRALPAAGKMQRVEDHFTSLLNRPWDLLEWPLHHFSLLQLEEQEFVLFLASDHAISDGLGNQQMLREFLQLYAGETLPPAVSNDAYKTLVEEINHHRDDNETQWLDDYLQQQGRGRFLWQPPQPAVANANDSCGCEDGVCDQKSAHHFPYRNKLYKLSQTETLALKQQAAAWGIPLNSVLLAHYLKALWQVSPESMAQGAILQVPTSGKLYPDVDASGVLGPFAQNMALSFAALSAEEPLGQLLQRVNDVIQLALGQGLDRAQTVQLAELLKNTLTLEAGQIPAWLTGVLDSSVKSNLYVPYTGSTHIRSTYGDLEILHYRAGTFNRPGTIDLQQELFADQLHIFVNFDSNRYDFATMDKLANDYLAQLQQFIKTPVQRATKTVSSAKDPSEHLASLCQIASSVLNRHFTATDADRDIEAEFGVDSLERVRIMTRIIGAYPKQVDRDQLFRARTLEQMALCIQSTTAEPQVSNTHSRENPPSCNNHEALAPDTSFAPPEVITLGHDLPEVPYLHFVERAKSLPDAVAVATGSEQICYAELDNRSNQLAWRLHNQGVGEGDIIALMCDRGINMVLAMLAIVKTGAAYLPIDPSLPSARINTMLGLADAGWLLTENAVAAQLQQVLTPETPLSHIVCLDEASPLLPVAVEQQWQQLNRRHWSVESSEPVAVTPNPDTAMAVLFTSGSTGIPKAIVTTHRSYMNRLRWHQNTFKLGVGERVSQNTSCSFDISIREIFWGLMAGGCVCPVEQDIVTNPWRLAQWLQEQRIQAFQFVPSLFAVFVQAMQDEDWQFPDLRWLLFSTEPLPVNLVRQWIDRFGMRIGIANQYGPSECAIEATCHIVPERPPESQLKMPIGFPVDNVHIAIMDEQGQRLPPNQVGEIYIGGVQLAKGYLANPDATDQAFVANPFADIPGDKLYRTGDLGMRLEDGSLSFHGRRDNQIKIRGNRVELGEVEAVLAKHPAVREVVVLVVELEDGLQKKLVAWLAADKLSEAEAKDWLGQHLPDYMVPHHMLWLARLPRNHNGKVERQHLRDQFRQTYPDAVAETTSMTQEQYLPLGPGQRWLLSYFDAPYQWWGMTRYRVKQEIDVGAFCASVSDMIQRHAILRTVFVEQDGQLMQKVMPFDASLPPPVECLSAAHLSEQQIDSAINGLATHFANAMDIGQWPLLQLWLVQRQDLSFEVCVVAHHLIADMVSGQIMFQQMWDHYAQHVLSAANAPLANTTTSPSSVALPSVAGYGDLVKVLQAKEDSGALEQDWQYWQQHLQEPLAYLPDHPQGRNIEGSSRCHEVVLTAEHSDCLLRHGKKHFNASLHSILLTPWYRLMAKATQQTSIAISHRMSGRNPDGDPLAFSQSVGNFAVNFPVVVEMDGKDSWQAQVSQVHQAMGAVPSGGLSYDWLASRMTEQQYPDQHMTPLRINYLGQADGFDSELFDIDWEAANQRFIPDEQRRSAEIEVWLLFKNKQLHVQLYYSHARFDDARMADLAADYLREMTLMLQSCGAETSVANQVVAK